MPLLHHGLVWTGGLEPPTPRVQGGNADRCATSSRVLTPRVGLDGRDLEDPAGHPAR